MRPAQYLYALSFFQVTFVITQVDPQTVVTCSCDLTANACDVNCCCDGECEPADIAVFTCSNATYNEDSKLCVNNLVFVNNLPTTSVTEDNGAFCIIRERDTARNFYTEPNILNTTEEFNSAVEQYQTYSYDTSSATSSSSSTTYYVAGDTIDVIYANGFTGKLNVPVSGIAGKCVDNNPASFMFDQSSNCSRRLSVLNACLDDPYIRASTFYSPDTFKVSQSPIINITAASSLNVTICGGEARPSEPSVSANQCTNVVKAVSYTVTYNGTDGISSVCASIATDNINESSIVQKFSISYVSSNTIANETIARSGNPGYLVGKSIRTAIGNNGNLTMDSNQLQLISSADGYCSNIAESIGFGEDQRTGCLLNFTTGTDCVAMLETVKDILGIRSLLNDSLSVYVATFGNTLETAVGDWVPVEKAGGNIPTPSTEVGPDGCEMLLGINYLVFFANTGSISNPQPKIIGVQYVPIVQTLKYQCYGNNCDGSGLAAAGSSDQYVEITTSVTFIDASSTPVTVLKERPTVNARLPSDFFYPFTQT